MQKSIYSVGQVNTYIKRMFRQDILLNALNVRGEISNLKYHTSGHIYFSLKDESGALRCVMFRSARKGLTFPMKDGDRVVVTGSIDLYERDGSCQLYVQTISLEGAGLLYERFLRLKQDLEDMGMFSPMYKKPIPAYCRRVGVITAPTGAAVRDIITVARRRNPGVSLILYPALVQGKEAAPSLIRGLQVLDRAGVDVIILGRGGGSIEDLWAFNEEAVARAVFDCETPVITAVGHETDTTIVDYVADLRAPTPSAAAELAVFSLADYEEALRVRQRRLCRAESEKLKQVRSRLENLTLRMAHLSPAYKLKERRRLAADREVKLRRLMSDRLRDARLRADREGDRLEKAARELLRDRQRTFVWLTGRFRGLNPLDKLKQGFSYVNLKDGGTLRSVEDAAPGDAVTIHVTDGILDARIEKTEKQRIREMTYDKPE